MGRNNENIAKARKMDAKLTSKQLKKWGLNYHELIFGKPTYDIFVDDKNLYHKKNWSKNIDNFLK